MKTHISKLARPKMSGHGLGVQLLTFTAFVGGPLGFGAGMHLLSEKLPEGRRTPKVENKDSVKPASQPSGAIEPVRLDSVAFPRVDSSKSD